MPASRRRDMPRTKASERRMTPRHDCASEENKGYVITEITHEARDDSFLNDLPDGK